MTQKTALFFKIGILLFGFSLLTISCSKDSISEVELTEIQQIQSKFSLENFNDEFVKNNLVIDWTSYNVNQENDSIPFKYEFRTSFKVKNTLKNGKQTLDTQYKLLAYKAEDNNWSIEIIKYLSNKTEKLSNLNYFSKNTFSGTLYHYNLKGENIKIKAYKNGILLNEFSDKKKGIISPTSKVPSIGEDTGGFWMFTRTQHYTDWYSGNSQIGFHYNYSVLNYTTSEYVWVSTGGSSNNEFHFHGGWGSGGINIAEEELIHIDNNLTNPCAKNIFTDLETEMIKKELLNHFMSTPNGVQLTFAESILKLFNDSNILGYSIINGNLANANASTKGASTTISNSYLTNATQLSIARTIIHEMIHAYLNVKYTMPMSTDDGADFQLKMNKFATDNGYKPNGTADDVNRFQHEFMGQYVDAIAFSLLSWDIKNGTGGINKKDLNGNDVLDWDYYKSMAFSGQFQVDEYDNIVSETDSFKAQIPDSNNRKEIVKNILNEQKGNSNAKGTKCN